MAFIDIKNLKKRYMVTRTETQEVLKGINVQFARGEFVALLGESGCGKSTFLNILAGLDFDYTGSIIINTEFIRDFSERELDHYRKNRVGIVFQSFNLIKQMTVFENVMLPLTLTKLTHGERTARADELIEEVGLTSHRDKYPNQLSGGQKQRVAIARALANNPFVLLADEPTGNLDAKSAEEITELLKKIAAQGRLVICVTHSEKMASNCTRVIKLEDGGIVADTQTNIKKEKHEKLIRPTAVKDNIDKKEILDFAKNNIITSLKRNLLVSIALGIGICAFVLMLFLGAGLKQYVETEMDTGSNKLQINVQKNTLGNFTTTEVDYFQNQIITGVAGVYNGSAASDLKMKYRVGSSYNTLYYAATTYDGFQMKLQYGVLPGNAADSADVLVSSSVARKLLPDEDTALTEIIGTKITMAYDTGTDKTFTVCGIFEDDTFDTVYCSYNVMKQLNNAPVNLLYVISEDVAHVNAIIDDIYFLITDAVITRMDTKAEDVLGYIDMGSMMLSVVSLIALVVSAIMIFIVMYISVVERTKEIGILRALGVRRKDVKRIFITEAGIIGIAAGLMGCIVALLLGIFVPIMSINIWYLLLGLGISFVLSVVSSFGPSNSASGLDPIEALRTE
jgi:ABC-type lipoprotein export system ATPase subunit/ABC-type antimicrobial peptide transport system permease subunit